MEIADELKIVEDYMRDRGLRWTQQRRLIAEVALATHRHFTAEELLDACRERDQGVSRATVYRTLAMLEDAGFVEGLDTGDGGRKFEHVLGHAHHDHMVCNKCGAIIEFHDDELELRQEAAAREHGFRITSHSLKLFGVCAACQRVDGEAGGGPQAGEPRTGEPQAGEPRTGEPRTGESQSGEPQSGDVGS